MSNGDLVGVLGVGALPTATVAYVLASLVSGRFGAAARVLLILLGPAVWIVVGSVLRSVFPAEPGCTTECYGDVVYVGVMLGGVFGTWLAVFVSWISGTRTAR
jgi:hypothetical protein